MIVKMIWKSGTNDQAHLSKKRKTPLCPTLFFFSLPPFHNRDPFALDALDLYCTFKLPDVIKY